MRVRTRAHVYLSQAIAQKEPGLSFVAWQLDPAVMNNIVRTDWFSRYQDILSRHNVRWKIKTYHGDE